MRKLRHLPMEHQEVCDEIAHESQSNTGKERRSHEAFHGSSGAWVVTTRMGNLNETHSALLD